MNDRTVARLERSFSRLAPRAQELSDRFYATLFAENPGLRPLYPANMAEQKRKLVAALVRAVGNLRTPERVAEPLLEIGSGDTEYRVWSEHYPIVRDTLIGVMADMSGDAWSRELAREWRKAIDGVCAQMIEGYRLAAAEWAVDCTTGNARAASVHSPAASTVPVSPPKPKRNRSAWQ